MRKKLKSVFHKLASPIANQLGYQRKVITTPAVEYFDSHNKNYLLSDLCAILKSANFYPKHIIDVGANHGTWTREILKHFPGAYYTMIEPQGQMKESVKDILSNPKISFHAVGAGKVPGSFMFTIVDRDDSCSFRYSAEEAKQKNFHQVEVPVVTLNEFIVQQNLSVPDIIKIDAEGLDLEVLEGASDFFGKTEVFLVEAGVVCKIFSNSVLKLVNFMDDKGYRLFDITDINRPFQPPVLWLVELVFVKKGGVVDSYKWF